MAATLVGIEGDAPDPDAMRKLLLLYSVTYALDGFPAVWMGDELALGDSTNVPEGAAALDGRWRQRPFMDWARAEGRGGAETLAGKAFQQLSSMARIRAAQPAFAADCGARATPSGDPGVLSFLRGEGSHAIQCTANFCGDARKSQLALGGAGVCLEMLSGEDVSRGEDVDLGPYQVRWLLAR